MNIEQAKQVLVRTHIAAIAKNRRASGMMLVSGPGIGKSEGTVQYCEALSRSVQEPVGLVVEMLATYMSADVRGFMLPVKSDEPGGRPRSVFSDPAWLPCKSNTAFVLPDGTWHARGSWDGAILPRYGVLFLDEFAQADEDVKKPAAELLLNGRVGQAELLPGYRVVAAGNRMS